MVSEQMIECIRRKSIWSQVQIEMSLYLRWLGVFLTLCGWVGTLRGQTTLPPEEIAVLVRQLSDSSFLKREEASAKLDELSESSLVVLEEYLSALEDPEAKARLKGIVTRLQQERKQRIIREFIRASSIPNSHEFQGWKSFSRALGSNDRKARLTFLELLEEYPDLVKTEIPSKEEGFRIAKLVAGEVTERLDIAATREVSIADGIALVYVSTVSGDLMDSGLEKTCNRVFSRRPFSTSAGKHPKIGSTLVSLYSKWSENARDLPKVLLSCLNSEIPAGGLIARKYLSDPNATRDAETFEYSMQAIAKFGTAEDLPVLEKWLSDPFTIREYQRIAMPDALQSREETFRVEARDMAFASTLTLSRQNPFLFFPLYRPHPLRVYLTESIGMSIRESPTARDERLALWKRLQEEQRAFPNLLRSQDPP
jgi:hypothetical protein